MPRRLLLATVALSAVLVAAPAHAAHCPAPTAPDSQVSLASGGSGVRASTQHLWTGHEQSGSLAGVTWSPGYLYADGSPSGVQVYAQTGLDVATPVGFVRVPKHHASGSVAAGGSYSACVHPY
ncbi:MAG TPA: hypothetical protein VNE62_00460 [Actinomycetota bacterium]|nr:hypothetical protein [Actinomycetota bacterium]